MQILDTGLLDYIRHRLGYREITSRRPRIEKKALELNVPAPQYAESFEKPDLNAYVGFIDLAGFSSAVHGKSPEDIANYLKPFLSRTIKVIRDAHGLIDKTIGDEIMFVLPEIDEDDGCEILFLGQLMGGLHDVAFEFQNRPFKIGLSYGKVRFFCIEGPGYSEWTTVGEPIHVAKRVLSIPDVPNPEPVSGAFGMSISSKSKEYVDKIMTHRLSYIAGFAGRFKHRAPEEKILKGVGQVRYAVLYPKGDEKGV